MFYKKNTILRSQIQLDLGQVAPKFYYIRKGLWLTFNETDETQLGTFFLAFKRVLLINMLIFRQ